MQARNNPSIRDVARVAEVSHQTVSRVLNAPDRVAPATRLRVERAIEMLGYRPNAAARTLKTHRSHVVGILVMPNSLFVATDGLSRLEATLRASGLRVLIAGTQGPTLEDMRRSVAPLLSFGVDAVVVAANERSAGELARELSRHMAVVAMQPGIDPAEGLSSVHIDLAAGISDIVEHLLARGDRVLDLITGPLELSTMRLRVDSWTHELHRHGLPLRPVDAFPMTPAGGYEAGERLIERGLPDGVLASNDNMAIGLVRAFHDRGIRVPEQVAVVGIDDFVVTSHTIPSITTLAQPYTAVAGVAADLVLEALAECPARHVAVRPHLITRESTAGRRPTS